MSGSVAVRAALPLAFLLAASASPGLAADRLTARLDPPAATVGDRVEATMELALEAGAPTTPPRLELDDRWGDAEILTRDGGPWIVDGETIGWRWTLELAAFRPGTLELPPLTAIVPGPEPRSIAMEGPVSLEIVSVLPAEGEAEPRPPTAPSGWPGVSPWWWIAGVLLLFAAAALVLWWRRRRSPAAIAGAPRLSPRDRLEAELAAVLGLDDAEAAHTRLSLALRRYLEGRLGFPAAEHTTREIRRDLRETGLPMSLQRDLLEILGACDAVKFARRDDGVAAARERAESVRGLADGIEQALRPPEPVEEAA